MRIDITPKEIARWKINTKFENWLSKKADNSDLWKRYYVNFYKIFDRKYYKKGLPIIAKKISFFSEKLNLLYSKKQIKKIQRDMIYSLHRFGASFDEYFLFEFYKKTAQERDSFHTEKRRYYTYMALNPTPYNNLLENKWETYNKFKKYYQREVLLLSKENNTSIQSVYSMFERLGKIIVKPVNELRGQGVKILSSKEMLDDFISSIDTSHSFIVEELITNVEEISSFHPQSLNTIRIQTLLFPDHVELLPPFIRMGCGDSCVDNGGAGGIFADIDLNTGIIVTKAHNEKGDSWIIHPDSQKQIIGTKIPSWNECVELSKRLAKDFPECKCIGWDLALTKKGWVLIEANHNPHTLMQIANKTGVMDKITSLIQVY